MVFLPEIIISVFTVQVTFVNLCEVDTHLRPLERLHEYLSVNIFQCDGNA